MNLLPGLRELRAPLAAGYLWLATLWLGLNHAGLVPTTRPVGNGEIAKVWALGGTLGRTVLLAALTFAAYLVGSFLEIDPDGLVAEIIATFVLFRFTPKYVHTPPEELQGAYVSKYYAKQVAQLLSYNARLDLMGLLEQRGHIPKTSGGVILATPRTQAMADGIIYRVLDEMPQLASRLLVKNKELYGKYDRLMSEATLRINVSLPLMALFITATWLSNSPIWLQVVLTAVSLLIGAIFLRQGFLRTVSAQNVIAQALTIEEIESRNIEPSKILSESTDTNPAGRHEPSPDV